jgi:hypothetical protein
MISVPRREKRPTATPTNSPGITQGRLKNTPISSDPVSHRQRGAGAVSRPRRPSLWPVVVAIVTDRGRSVLLFMPFSSSLVAGSLRFSPTARVGAGCSTRPVAAASCDPHRPAGVGAALADDTRLC